MVNEIVAELSTTRINVEVRRNQDATSPSAQQWSIERSIEYDPPEDDFILWPTLIEVYVDVENTSPATSEIVAFAAGLLEKLRNEALSAVAACDFEDELPSGGGINLLRRSTE